MPQTSVEQRRFPRAAFRRSVRFRPLDDALFSGQLAQDISQGGLRFTSSAFIPLGTQIKMQIKLEEEGRVLEVMGKVVWEKYLPHKDMFQLGLEFTGDASYVQWNIARYVFNA